MGLKGSKTEKTSRTRSPANPRPTAAISISPTRRTSKAIRMLPPFSARPRRAKPDTPTATSNISSRRRSGHRPADRTDQGQSRDRRRRRNARIHRHVSGHGQGRPRRRLRRDRRLVRDAGQGRALARQPLPEGPDRIRLSRQARVPRPSQPQLRAGRACGAARRRVASTTEGGLTHMAGHVRRQPRGADPPSARLAEPRVLDEAALSRRWSGSSTSATAAGAA